MANLPTPTIAPVLTYPSQQYIDRDPRNGRLYALTRSNTNVFSLYRSTDGGATWSVLTTLTRANVQEWSGIFVDNGGEVHWCYRTNESGQDRVWYRKFMPDAATPVWSAEQLLAFPANGGTPGSVHQGIDFHIVVYQDRTARLLVAVGMTSGARIGVFAMAFSLTAAGVATYTPVLGTRTWLATGTGRITPVVDIEHNGDGKSSSVPHVWISWGRTTMYAVKLAWSGQWTGPTSPVVLSPAPATPAQDSVSARWDGQRWCVAIPHPVSTGTVQVLERNRANSSTTIRQSPTHPAGVVRNCAVSYNARTGDLRVYAVGTSSTVLHYTDYVRATNSWTAWTQVLATAVLGTTGNNYSVRRGSFGSARHDVLTAHASNVLTHTSQVLAYAPNLPVWDPPAIGYEHGAAADINGALALDWIFSDPDPADVQSAWALSRQIGAGALSYFRASDSTWQAAEVKNVGATTNRALAAGWGLNTDAPHAYRVKVWDSTDVASLYSDAFVVVPSVQVNPTITAPAAAAVLTTDTVTATWTVAEQTAYRVTLATNPGGVVVHDSGWQTSTDTSYTPPTRLADLTGWTVTVQTRNNEGLASTVASVSFTVDYLEPPTPTLVATPSTANGWIAVAVTNPAPSGGQPALVDQDLYRRVVGDTGNGLRVAAGLGSGATYNDWTATAGVPYEYRALARGVNGTSIFSTWTP